MAGLVSASRTCPKSSVTPRFGAPASAMASSVAETLGRIMMLRGSLGLYSIETGKSGACSATWRKPSTSQSKRRA